MKTFFIIAVLFSSASFLFYSISYFTSDHLKNEFKRFQLEKFGLLTIILEAVGSLGLIVGLFYMPILLISSAGLALLMLFALMFRVRSKDSLQVSIPALFYLLLNALIFYLGFLGISF